MVQHTLHVLIRGRRRQVDALLQRPGPDVVVEPPTLQLALEPNQLVQRGRPGRGGVVVVHARVAVPVVVVVAVGHGEHLQHGVLEGGSHRLVQRLVGRVLAFRHGDGLERVAVGAPHGPCGFQGDVPVPGRPVALGRLPPLVVHDPVGGDEMYAMLGQQWAEHPHHVLDPPVLELHAGGGQFGVLADGGQVGNDPEHTGVDGGLILGCSHVVTVAPGADRGSGGCRPRSWTRCRAGRRASPVPAG